MGAVPQKVLEAIKRGDRAALSAMGRKGAATRKRNAEARAEREEVFAQIAKAKRAEEFEQLRRDANEHICPIDPEDD